MNKLSLDLRKLRSKSTDLVHKVTFELLEAREHYLTNPEGVTKPNSVWLDGAKPTTPYTNTSAYFDCMKYINGNVLGLYSLNIENNRKAIYTFVINAEKEIKNGTFFDRYDDSRTHPDDIAARNELRLMVYFCYLGLYSCEFYGERPAGLATGVSRIPNTKYNKFWRSLTNSLIYSLHKIVGNPKTKTLAKQLLNKPGA